MTRDVSQRFADMHQAIERCGQYAPLLSSADVAEMAYDAILRNLAVLGEAVRSLPADVKDARPDVPWASIAGLRNVVVHEYFQIDREVILDIVENHLRTMKAHLPVRGGC